MSQAERARLMAEQHRLARALNELGQTFGYSPGWTSGPQYRELAAAAEANSLRIKEIDAAAGTPETRLVCGASGELLYRDPDGRGRHANQHVCDHPEELPVGRCVDCGADVDPASDDPAVKGCYANRGFDHVRVVGR